VNRLLIGEGQSRLLRSILDRREGKENKRELKGFSNNKGSKVVEAGLVEEGCWIRKRK